MIISNEKIQQIRDVIEKYFKAIIFTISGRDDLTDQEIQDLYISNLIDLDKEDLISNAYTIGKMYANDPSHKIKLKEFFEKYKYELAPTSEREKYAMKHVAQSVSNHLNNLQNKVQTNIENLLNNVNISYRNENLTETVSNVISEGIKQRKTIGQVASQLRSVSQDTYKNWKLIATTEMATAMTLGEADAIVARKQDPNPNKIYVFKTVTKDAALCKTCRNAYLMPDGVTPKIYTLSELQANGTNYGRKSSELLPTITPIHPGCRCNLVELPIGWGFENGKITFIDPTYNMYLSQKEK